MDYRISITLLRFLIYNALQLGFSERELLEHAELSKEEVENPDGFISSQKYTRLYSYLIRKSNDPFLGLRFGKNFQFSAMGIFGLVIINAPTGRNLYKKMIAFQDILGDDITTKFIESDEDYEVQICLLHERNEEVDRHCVDSIIAKNIRGVRLCLGEDIKPLKVRLKIEKPKDETQYNDFFRCPIEYQSNENSIHFPKFILDSKNPLADGRLEQHFDEIAANLLNHINANESVSKQVSRLLLEEIHRSELSIEQLAEKLPMGVRTLQRKLSEEGTSFKQLFDDVKKQIAIKYLREKNLAISEISFFLGFSEPSAFHRSFKRWTGTTPLNFRNTEFVLS